MSEAGANRRDFLTGRAVRDIAESAGNALADELASSIPSRGPTVMLRTTAMACDFDVMMNAGEVQSHFDAASQALDLVHELEDQLSVYRADSEISRLNQQAASMPFEVRPNLFELLIRSKQLSELTEGAFDPATGALIRLWRDCLQESRIPTAAEVERALSICGIQHVLFEQPTSKISFQRAGVEFNLGAIGKGYAVDRAAELLKDQGVENWMIHGGRSSIRAQGTHAGRAGWPIGLQNPLLPDKPFATLLLRNASLATSGTAVQWFRHEGKRYGHILDPRTGWPVESLLSVSVIAPDSALADALSTAFFVLGVEKSLACCDNLPSSVGVIFFALPKQGQRLEPVLHNVAPETWFVS